MSVQVHPIGDPTFIAKMGPYTLTVQEGTHGKYTGFFALVKSSGSTKETSGVKTTFEDAETAGRQILERLYATHQKNLEDLKRELGKE